MTHVRFLYQNIFLLLIILLFNSDSTAQNTKNVRFQSYTNLNGLPSNRVDVVYKDKRGFLWIGTDGGVCRFDGVKFTALKINPKGKKPGNPEYLSSVAELNDSCLLFLSGRGILSYYNYYTGIFSLCNFSFGLPDSVSIESIKKRDNGGIILVSELQMIVYDSKLRKEAVYPLQDLNNYKSGQNSVKDLLEDIHGNFWFSTYSEGLFFYDKTTRKFNNISYIMPQQIPGIAFDYAKKNLLVTTLYQGLLSIDITSREIKKQYSLAEKNSDDFTQILTALAVQNDSIVWVGSINNLYRLNTKTGLYETYINNPDNSNALVSNNILELHTTFDNLWIGTIGGLSRLTLIPRGMRLYSNDPIDKYSLANNTVNVVLRISKRHIVFGSEKGISILDEKENKFYNYLPPSYHKKSYSPIVISLFKDLMGQYWLGTWGDRIFKVKFFGLQNSQPSVFFEDTKINDADGGQIFYTKQFQQSSNGDLYITTWGNGLLRIKRDQVARKHPTYSVLDKTTTGLPTNHLAAFVILHDTLFISTGGGLLIVDPVSGKWRVHRHAPSENENWINSTTFVNYWKENFLIYGTYGGVLQFDIRSGKSKILSLGRSDEENASLQGAFDSNGKFWHNKGHSAIAALNPETGQQEIFDLKQDAGGFHFSFGDAYRDTSGDLFFCGYTGVLKIVPDRVIKNPNPPPVYITGFQVFQKSRKPESDFSEMKHITLDYTEQDFTLSYAALNFINPWKNNYKYMLEGYDKNWIEAGNRTDAIYTNISPGRYRFRVLGSNNDGVWNSKGAAITIVITPPFWDTLLFRLSVVILIVGTLFYVINRRFAKLELEKKQQEAFAKQLIETQERERKRVASELHDSLGQNLLVIKNLLQLLPETPQNSGDLKQLDVIISESIDETRDISARLHPHQLDTLGMHKALAEMVSRFARLNKLRIESSIDDVTGLLSKENEINVYRIVQESLNNILKHSKADHARVSVILNSGKILLTIKDNGIGIDEQKDGVSEAVKRGFGLKNISERVKLIHGNITITSSPGNGTTIEIEVPV